MARYLVDAMLGGLPPYLRICGHDAAFALDRDVESDDAVSDLATTEGRTLVTRDEALAARVDDSVPVRSTDTEAQLRELAEAGVALAPTDESTRCGRCNGRLRRLERDGAGTDPLPDYVPDAQWPVWRCRSCGQYFWRGSHWDRMVATLEAVRGD